MDYSLVYFHHGLTSKNKPPIRWLWEVYKALDRRYKKNLKSLYLVHPTNFIRVVWNFFKPIIRYGCLSHKSASPMGMNFRIVSSCATTHSRIRMNMAHEGSLSVDRSKEKRPPFLLSGLLPVSSTNVSTIGWASLSAADPPLCCVTGVRRRGMGRGNTHLGGHVRYSNKRKASKDTPQVSPVLT